MKGVITGTGKSATFIPGSVSCLILVGAQGVFFLVGRKGEGL